MKVLIKIFIIMLLPCWATAQDTFFYAPATQHEADSLQLILQISKNDTVKMSVCKDLCLYYSEINRDTSLYFAEKQLVLANKLNQKLWQAASLVEIGYLAQRMNNYPKSLTALVEAAKIVEDKKNEIGSVLSTQFSGNGNVRDARLIILATTYEQIGFLFGVLGINDRATLNYQKALKTAEIVDDKIGLGDINMNFGELCLRANKLDSALTLEKTALKISNTTGYIRYQGFLMRVIGQVYLKKGNLDSAKTYLHNGAQIAQIQNNLADEADIYIPLSELYISTHQLDSSLYYAKKALEIYKKVHLPAGINSAYSAISSTYQFQGKSDSAFHYLKIAKSYSDSLNKAEIEKIYQFQNIDFNYKVALQEVEKKQEERLNRIKIYGLLIGLGLFSGIGFYLYRNNQKKQRANTILENTLKKLKSTQNQLVQKEKLASLGELTAGIAHEIQNPLNFVNNFSELSVDLVKELQEERQKTKDKRDEVLEDEILKDLTANQKKINHHGKRASSIVKGMLEHSRTSTGERGPTDINKLADEYLRLSYHGLRAKDKTFNADYKTDFDESLPKLNVVPQDIGRVILNLINNAFYAVNERAKQNDAGRHAGLPLQDYAPLVTVSTKKIGDKIEISVKDNGNGIPDKIKDKIFQPFFTTKPTGEGTGLGLSLAYDIVTKGHGGTLEVESLLGEGSEFIITLQNS